jgi:uncharacterized protein
MRHHQAISITLGFAGIQSEVSSYNYRGSKLENGLQIDMLIDRADRSINLCEMKFYNNTLTLDKVMADRLRVRREQFRVQYKKKRQLINTIITPYGVEMNAHSLSQVDNVITLLDLFRLERF